VAHVGHELVLVLACDFEVLDGLVPTRQGTDDRIRRDEGKNLVICPLRHDGDFMQVFYEGWRIVQAFLAADAQVPGEVALPSPIEREVARILFERREFPVLEVVEAIKPYGQPELLQTDDKQVDLRSLKGDAATDMVVATISRNVD
jgi:hypothetical protein